MARTPVAGDARWQPPHGGATSRRRSRSRSRDRRGGGMSGGGGRSVGSSNDIAEESTNRPVRGILTDSRYVRRTSSGRSPEVVALPRRCQASSAVAEHRVTPERGGASASLWPSRFPLVTLAMCVRAGGSPAVQRRAGSRSLARSVVLRSTPVILRLHALPLRVAAVPVPCLVPRYA